MAIYEFSCVDCKSVLTKMFSMSSCPSEIDCDCGGTAKKSFIGSKMFVKSSSNKSLNEMMKDKNKRAGKRMRKEWDKPAQLVDQKQLSRKEI